MGFQLSLKCHLVQTHLDLAGAPLFYRPFIWECVLQVALLLSPNPGPMQRGRLHSSAAESSVTYYELLVANVGGSSFFLTLLFPGLLSITVKSQLNPSWGDRQEGTCWAPGFWLVPVCGLWGDPRSTRVWFSIAPTKTRLRNQFIWRS